LPVFGNLGPQHHLHNQYPGQSMGTSPGGSQWNQHFMARNQVYPYQTAPPSQGWNPVHPGNYYPLSYAQQMQMGPQGMYHNQYYPQKESQSLFHNPLQPKEEQIAYPYMPMNGYPIMNPYPTKSFMPKQSGGMQSILNSFKSQDGSVDLNKMISTAGQMANAVSQVTSLVKGFGGIFKA
jgi:hypothetical protein